MKEKAFERGLPEGYREVAHIDASNMKFGVIFNIVSVVIAVIVIAISIGVAALFGGPRELITPDFRIVMILFSLSLFAYVVLHELVHGIAYKITTGEKLTFGVSWSCAFCGVPHIYTYARTARCSASAPLIVFSILFVILTVVMFFVSPVLYYLLAVIFALHLGGCSGDMYILFKLASYKDERLLMRDTGPEQFFYLPDET